MNEGFVDDEGVRIHYVDHGGPSPDAPALLVVHATGFHGRVWDPIVPRLAARFRVVAIDQRGHGDSDKPESGYEWQKLGRDVLAVVDDLGLTAPRGMGHSSGSTALILAESARPGTFSRLVLMDPVTPPPEFRAGVRGDNPLAAGARRRRAVWDSREQMVERLREGTPLATWREEFLRAYVENGTVARSDGRFELKCPPAAEAQMYEHSLRHDGWERLGTLSCPVLLLVGERSELWGSGAAARRTLRRGRVDFVAGHGHFFPMEAPDAAVDAALPFLEGR